MRLTITNKQFKELLTKLINEINTIQHNTYAIEIEDDSAKITQTDGSVFYLTYMDEFMALKTIYNISMYMKCNDEGKPALLMFNNL